MKTNNLLLKSSQSLHILHSSSHKMEIENVGYWGPRTASEDWCEPNYVYSHYIAEFWNVLSSIPIVFVGLWVVYNALKYKYHTRFLIPGIFMAFIGVGSIWFHGTLKYEGQVVDELSMIYAMVCYLYVLIEDRPKIKYKWLPYALVLYCIAFTLTYAFLPQYFVYFVLTFIAGSALSMYWSYRFVQIETDPRLIRQYWVCFFVWTGAFFLCWLPDKLFCSTVGWMNLHAIFHLCSAMCPMSILMYICRCHYQFDLARRTGLIVDEDGNVVTAPSSLLKVIVDEDSEKSSASAMTELAFPTYKFVKVGPQSFLPYVHLRRKDHA